MEVTHKHSSCHDTRPGAELFGMHSNSSIEMFKVSSVCKTAFQQAGLTCPLQSSLPQPPVQAAHDLAAAAGTAPPSAVAVRASSRLRAAASVPVFVSTAGTQEMSGMDKAGLQPSAASSQAKSLQRPAQEVTGTKRVHGAPDSKPVPNRGAASDEPVRGQRSLSRITRAGVGAAVAAAAAAAAEACAGAAASASDAAVALVSCDERPKVGDVIAGEVDKKVGRAFHLFRGQLFEWRVTCTGLLFSFNW